MKHSIFLSSSIWLLVTFWMKKARGDAFDDAVQASVQNLNIRGASIAFYDANTLSEPIVRAYGRVASGANSASVTPDTTFMLASVSKVFAGAAVAAMVDQGIISLDDDICNVLPSNWQQSACRNPNYPNDVVTWRMLVTHRSSLRDNIPSVRNQNGNEVEPSYGPSGGYVIDAPAAGNPTCPLSDVTGFYRDFLTDKPTETSVGAGVTLQGGGSINWYNVGQSNGGAWRNFRPGQRVSYSNFAVGYIAALVELATGMSFAEFCHQNLFQPLGMTHAAWFREDLPTGTREAVPVEYDRGSFTNIGHYCFIDYASGQLRLSANDMSKWCSSMLNFGAPALWAESIGRLAFRCQEQNPNGSPVSSGACEFGVNWILLDNSKKATAEAWMSDFAQYDWTDGVMHDGAEAGSQTQILILPNAGVFVATLTNTDLNDDYAAQKLASAVVNAPLPPNPSPGPPPSPPTGPPPPANGSVQVQIELFLDEYPSETGWSVTDSSGQILYEVEEGTLFQAEQVVSTPLELLPGDYVFEITDTFGDGMCCDFGEGRYDIYAIVDGNSITLAGARGNFDFERVVSFTVPGATGPQPTPNPTPEPTPSPTPRPTPSPTPDPTPSPTPPPVASPTPNPTPEPTPGPTPSPTPPPVASPTPNPTPEPTPGPTPSPTPPPVASPTPNPTPGPTPPQTCQDSDAEFFVDTATGNRLCNWLTRHMDRYGYLCQFVDVASKCRSTCSACAIFVA